MLYNKRSSIIEDLILAPWWISAGILVFGNIFIRYIIPEWFSIDQVSPILSGGVAKAMPIIANLFSMIAGFAVVMSGGRTIWQAIQKKKSKEHIYKSDPSEQGTEKKQQQQTNSKWF